MEGVIALIAIPGLAGWVAWLTFTTIRRYRTSRLQAELHTRMLEKFSSGQELLTYAQTDAGKRFLESLAIEDVTPYRRIIGSLQAGIVLVLLGIALLFLRNRVFGAEEAFLVFGTLSFALGIGCAISSAAAYYLSRSFGLLDRPLAQRP
ncbi:MAG TPA: hypothetical protein VMH85_04575 [Terriglobales bacterium]|nr:hypothetical protein [Terriglobales bacterium]